MPKLGMDVGFQGESGSRSDIAKLSQMTPNGLQARRLLRCFTCSGKAAAMGRFYFHVVEGAELLTDVEGAHLRNALPTNRGARSRPSPLPSFCRSPSRSKAASVATSFMYAIGPSLKLAVAFLNLRPALPSYSYGSDSGKAGTRSQTRQMS